jgi:hypothetical protein
VTCYPRRVRLVARTTAAAAFFLSTLGLLSAVVMGGCGDEAVAIDACRRIEEARCLALTACKVSQEEADYCVAFYRDQCLHGLRNATDDPQTTMVDACVGSIRAVEACARAGATSMAGCTAAPLASPEAAASVLPCTVIQRSPELLAACSFVAPNVPDAGIVTPPPDAGDTSDAASD